MKISEVNNNHFLMTQTIKDVIGNDYLVVVIDKYIMQPYIDLFHQIVKGERGEIMSANLLKRNHQIYHLTVMNVPEYYRAITMFGGIKVPINDIELLGIGMASNAPDNESYYVVAKSDRLAELRESLELPPKDFHITIGFDKKDVFGVRKNVALYNLN